MAMSHRRYITDQARKRPVIQHTREPLAPLPLPGCHCDDCENARDDQHYARVGELMGIDEAKPAEGKS